MSQKTNPISLRLQNSNKHFESCWYSDFFYDQVLGDEIQLRLFIEGLLYQAGRTKPLPSNQSQYKRYCTLLFFLDQRAERHKREFSLKLSRESVDQVFLPRIKLLPSKNKVYTSAWDGLLLIKAQNILQQEGVIEQPDCTCSASLSKKLRESLSQKERYNSLLEEGTRCKRLALTQNDIQEYLYNYAIKGSFLEARFLSGISSTMVFNKGCTGSATKPRRVFASRTRPVWSNKLCERAGLYNSIINPGIKDNPFVRVSSYNKGPYNSHTNSKVFLSFSITSFAIVKVLFYIEDSPLKTTASLSFAGQSFNRVELLSVAEQDLPSVWHNAIKVKNSVFLKNRLVKESTDNIFSVQEEERKNTFRRLIIDQHSQSSQNRLSYYFVKSIEKRFRRANTLTLVHDKNYKGLSTFKSATLLEKTNFKKNATVVDQQEWRSKSLGLSRHTELFLNVYSGSFGYHTIYSVRALSPFQSAGFLLESIAYLLQRKSSFRQIKDDIFRELDQYELVKGARLSCAGRLGGRSKKAQKAKTQSAQWGETSLTVFSSRLAFVSKGVSTTYGKVGVKLWLCYKT